MLSATAATLSLAGVVAQLQTLVTQIQSLVASLSSIAASQQAQLGAAAIDPTPSTAGARGGAPDQSSPAGGGCSCGSHDAIAGAVSASAPLEATGGAAGAPLARASTGGAPAGSTRHDLLGASAPTHHSLFATSPAAGSEVAGAGDSQAMPALSRANPRSVDEAIAWAKGQAANPSQSWHDLCLSFVAHAYGWSASGVPYAIDHYKNAPASARHDGDRNPPKGALVYWDTGQRAGHVALYLGNGMIASNDINKPGAISIVPMSDIGQKWHAKYLGWQAPDFPKGA